MILYYFCIAILCHVINAVNETSTTEAPEVSTTQFFTTSLPPNTYFPTLKPTTKPTGVPSVGPTEAPIVKFEEGNKFFEIALKVGLQAGEEKFTADWVKNNEQFLLANCVDALGDLAVGENTECVLGEVKLMNDDDETGRRRLAEEYDRIEIEYLILIDDPKAYNVFQESVSSGEFGEEFSQGMTDNFGDKYTVDTDSIEFTQSQGDGKDFIGIKEETFADKMESPYILLGVVCILVGTVWLIQLQSKIDYKPPTYFQNAQTGNDGVGNTMAGTKAVEMQQINSGESE